MGKLLTVVIPSYNEEDNVENTACAVLNTLEAEKIECELLFVSDGSRDNTFGAVSRLANGDKRIRCIEFSRNFGKEAAIMAGLSEGRGDCFVIMDCDLQHPPETMVEMFRLWEQGYKVVEGTKKNRGKQFFLKRFFAAIFYGIISALSGFDMRNSSDYKLLDREVAQTLTALPEKQTFFRALTFWTGYKSCRVFYEVGDRKAGKTKWNVHKLVRYAISNIISFSSLPLKVISYLGTFIIFLGGILGAQTLIRYFMGKAIEGFTTVILLQLIIGGCIITGLGLIGRYVAAIYEEVKGRPKYIIQKDTEKEDGNE